MPRVASSHLIQKSLKRRIIRVESDNFVLSSGYFTPNPNHGRVMIRSSDWNKYVGRAREKDMARQRRWHGAITSVVVLISNFDTSRSFFIPHS
jgi:hypothetical protein